MTTANITELNTAEALQEYAESKKDVYVVYVVGTEMATQLKKVEYSDDAIEIGLVDITSIVSDVSKVHSDLVAIEQNDVIIVRYTDNCVADLIDGDKLFAYVESVQTSIEGVNICYGDSNTSGFKKYAAIALLAGGQVDSDGDANE